MHTVLERFAFGLESTLGRLYVPGELPCLILEEPVRAEDEFLERETAIPAGTYPITLRTIGGFHARYLDRFGEDFHRGMLWLRDVPGRKFILVHCGNTAVGVDDDTDGCLLTGSSPGITQNAEFHVAGSERAYRRIYPVVVEPLLREEEVTIEVRHRP